MLEGSLAGSFDDSGSNDLVRFSQVALDEARHEDIAAESDLFFQVKSLSWSIDAQFERLDGLSRHIAANEEFPSQVNATGGKSVGLQASLEVVKA